MDMEKQVVSAFFLLYCTSICSLFSKKKKIKKMGKKEEFKSKISYFFLFTILKFYLEYPYRV